MSRSSEDAQLSPGDIVGGRYRVIQSVGEGPLDRLYEAQDVDRHERVIIRIHRRSLGGDEQRVRAFEDQARIVRGSASGSASGPVAGAGASIRVLELSRDAELGHFAALSNRESLPVAEVLALLAGVDGDEAAPAAPAALAAPADPAAPSDPGEGFQFPASESQVQLETLDPPVPATDRERPRYAEPRRPRKLDTLELDTPRISRSTGPRPAMKLQRPSGRRQALRRVAFLVVVLGGVVAGIYAYARHLERKQAGEDEPAPNAMTSAMTDVMSGVGMRGGWVMAPTREVQIRFRVTPVQARMRIQGRIVRVHSVRVPASHRPFKVRFEAPGHVSRSIKVVPDRSRDVLIVLNKSP